ncbi:uncharacterized protein BP5553_02891 [Venustampulla echinocandica]|uniref:SPT2 chromatin protein n=1 Tax=Venustampulla echinocandica TaxID=2656787 RepID=A0A370TSP7_9HELO|nr:uncharacterized protein BP5553_02891 [Venustampulla echinocandica]RDL38551.1 hypothetical protein BP5553_02891 [Venustampulla echinocandica]
MPIGDLLAQISGEPSPTQSTTPLPLPSQRKVHDARTPKRPETDMQRPSTTSRPSSNIYRPVGPGSRPGVGVGVGDVSMAKAKLGTNGRTPSAMSPTLSSAFKNGQPTTPPTDGPPKPPKKGSFAEIMARAKGLQSTAGQIGKIQHKRIEKAPSKREREEMKAQKSSRLQKNVGPNGKFRNAPGAATINGKKARVGGKAEEPIPEKKVKKAALATTGYAGTARPKPGSAKQPSKSSTPSSSRYDRDRDRYDDDRASSSRRYTYVSEEEEEDDYASDVSSDMEAAAFEVDEEEEFASRIARKEDALALAEENRLKKEKAEKKRRLMEMARKRR